MTSKASVKRLEIFSFKLNALLDITQAINANLSSAELLQRYEKILKEDLDIGKVMILKHQDEWKCILNSGFRDCLLQNILVERDLLYIEDITSVTASGNPALDQVDIVIPVWHNNSPLAYVLIGDIDEEQGGVSPVIKHLHFIQTLSNILLVAIENIRLHRESLRQEAMKKELELASKMQNMLIPSQSSLPQSDKLKIYAHYHPHLEVGGDYYDVIQLDQHEIGFCIADVSGKGISAALLMSNFQANLRALFSRDISLRALVERLNERVMSSANGEKFITLFVARYNTKTRELEYINAGHNPPIVYEVETGTLSHLKKGCTGMGMLDELPSIESGVIHINQITKLMCYTDGLVELLDSIGVNYGMELIDGQLTNKDSLKDNIDHIIESQGIEKGNAAIFDDITILGLEFL
jgi:phosphoserine phosphatase RsbU/P